MRANKDATKNMVSSLPFLAPFFVRKAKEYRSRHSHRYGYGSYANSRRRGKGSQAYNLSVFSKNDNHTSESSRSNAHAYVTTTSPVPSDGQDNVWNDDMLRQSDEELVQRPDNAIMKSVSYTVEVNRQQLQPDDRHPGSAF